MNSSIDEREISLIAASMTRFNSNRIGFGKFRDTKKKINREVRKNRRIICKDSRRANR